MLNGRRDPRHHERQRRVLVRTRRPSRSARRQHHRGSGRVLPSWRSRPAGSCNPNPLVVGEADGIGVSRRRATTPATPPAARARFSPSCRKVRGRRACRRAQPREWVSVSKTLPGKHGTTLVCPESKDRFATTPVGRWSATGWLSDVGRSAPGSSRCRTRPGSLDEAESIPRALWLVVYRRHQARQPFLGQIERISERIAIRI